MERIYLVGAMGAGKTAVGRELARALGYSFFDTDQVVCERTGVDISFIFEKEGEAGFRCREANVLEELSRNSRCVVATGGGIVMRAENRNLMKSSGLVVYLAVSPEVQKYRARKGPNRPLLDDPDPEQALMQLSAQRSPLYADTADITVDTDNRKVKDVCREILAKIGGN